MHEKKYLVQFGLLISLILFSISILIIKNDLISYFTLYLAIILLIFSLIYPNLIKPIFYLWVRIGFFISKIINPIVLSMIYFLIFCPFGLILRKFKLLEFNSESKNNTFWKEKVNKSRTINFKDQF